MWFLVDENLPPLLCEQLRLRLPGTRIARVGDTGAPNYGTSDPALLRWCAREGAILITTDRATMPMHMANHIKRGAHLPGMLLVRPRFNVGDILDAVELIVGAVSDRELADQYVYIPV